MKNLICYIKHDYEPFGIAGHFTGVSKCKRCGQLLAVHMVEGTGFKMSQREFERVQGLGWIPLSP